MQEHIKERRKYSRIDVRVSVGVMVRDLGDRVFIGTISNIGADGVGLIINTFLPQGTTLFINFELQEGYKIDGIEAQVIRSREAEDKFFSAVRFITLDAELKRKLEIYVGSILFLKKIKPFSTLTDEETWNIRKISKEVYYQEGQKIFEEGVEGDAFYIMINGKVKIVKKNPQGKEETLAVVKEGEFFGEIALLDEGVRSAGAVASENASLFVVTRADFKKLLDNNDVLSQKLLWVFVRTLSHRLREVDKVMADMFFTSIKKETLSGEKK